MAVAANAVAPSPARSAGADIVTDDEDMVMTLGMSFSSSPTNIDSFVTPQGHVTEDDDDMSGGGGGGTGPQQQQQDTKVEEEDDDDAEDRLGMGGVEDDTGVGPRTTTTGRWK